MSARLASTVHMTRKPIVKNEQKWRAGAYCFYCLPVAWRSRIPRRLVCGHDTLYTIHYNRSFSLYHIHSLNSKACTAAGEHVSHSSAIRNSQGLLRLATSFSAASSRASLSMLRERTGMLRSLSLALSDNLTAVVITLAC